MSTEEFYTKGSRRDATCKDCIKAKKRKKRPGPDFLIFFDKISEMQKIIESWEIAILDGYLVRLKDINDRVDRRVLEDEVAKSKGSSNRLM